MTPAKPKGRPPKDVALATQSLMKDFAASQPSDPLFWGAEHRAQLAMLKALRGDIMKRSRSTTTLEEATSLSVMQKQVLCVHSLVEVVANSGAETSAFAEVFDYQTTLINLEPKALIPD